MDWTRLVIDTRSESRLCIDEGRIMNRYGRIIVLAVILAVVPATALAGSRPSVVPGAWRILAPAPFAIPQGQTSVWTGRQLIVFGRRPVVNPAVDVAEAYDPAADSWTRLAPPPGPDYVPGYKAVWTGKQMLAFGAFHSVAFTPATGKWRELRRSVQGGSVVWTGREAIGWGGGCCGDAWSNGTAYNPTTDTYRPLPRSPLAASQRPLGAWTGRELVLLVSGIDPEGQPYPARLARAAAYNPKTNSWRRIAPLPAVGLRLDGNAVWDGKEVLVTGVGGRATGAFAYNPTTNRWRRLASLPAARLGATAVWAGKQLILWGGHTSNASLPGGLRTGLAYEPRTDLWSTISPAPTRAGGTTVAWTGRELIVWGGVIGTPAGTDTPPRYLKDGAAFRPSTP